MISKLVASRVCPLCGNDSVEVLFFQNLVLPENLPLGTKQVIVCCDQCGFVYADIDSSQDRYDLFYAQFSKYADPHTYMGGGVAADIKRLQQTAIYLAHVLPDKSNRIIDIGCANGVLLGALQQLGYTQLYGVDPSDACIQNVIKQYGIDAYVGSLTRFPPNLDQFDLVILSHVLEHVKDVQPALHQIRALLADLGYLYIEVPDASRYVDFMFSPFQEFNLEHINHFSSLSLTHLLSICGFRIIESGQKLIESAPGISNPAIFVIAVKESDFLLNTTRLKDESLPQHIHSYIEASKQMLAKIDSNLQRILIAYPRIIVWGTGQLVMKLLSETVLANADITAFVDSNPALQGQSLNGIPILSPSQIVDQLSPILVSSTLYYEDIRRFIVEEMKLSNPVLSLL